MHHVEKEIANKCNSISYWRRYIDDIFFITQSHPNDLLIVANSVNKYIQFTLEMPIENRIAFLDTMVKKADNHFDLELYIKSTF